LRKKKHSRGLHKGGGENKGKKRTESRILIPWETSDLTKKGNIAYHKEKREDLKNRGMMLIKGGS